jgi:hypothetical protein
MNITTEELAAAEFAAEMTALSRRITAPNSRRVVAAISTDGRWGYEKEGRLWVAFQRANNGVGSTPHYAGSLDRARHLTFDADHPVHGPAREPRPMRFSVM